MNKKYKITTAVVIIAILAVVGGLVFFSLREPEKEKKAEPTPVPTQAADISGIRSAGTLQAMITAVDLDSSSITLMSLADGEEQEFVYTGATSVYTKYGRMIHVLQLNPGDFVTVSYDEESRLISIKGSETVWSYKNIFNMIIEDDIKRITIVDSVYRYDDNIKVLLNGRLTDLSSINSLDVLSAYGVDNMIYLIKVVSGHGVFKLKNENDFVGGTLLINGNVYSQITENMTFMLAEGTYSVTAKNGSLRATVTVRIDSEKTSVLDLAPFSPEPVASGKISFSVSPYGAELYVDGIRSDYSEPIVITYGTHDIRVLASGYTSYDGVIDVNRSDMSFDIRLSAQTTPSNNYDDVLYTDKEDSDNNNQQNKYNDYDIPDSTSDPGVTYAPGESEGNVTPTPSKNSEDEDIINRNNEGEIDDESVGHSLTMTIRCTEGCSVYINDTLAGTVTNGVLSVTKPKGTIVVRLVKEGYITRTYTVSIDNDGKDAVFTFPDMVRE